jgi:hypothetical protein
VNHIQKVSRKGGNDNQSGQTPSGSGDTLRRFSRCHFATPFRGVGESCSLIKKVTKWYKRLKDCYKRRPKNERKTVATKKLVAAAITQIPLKATAHCRRLPGAASPGYVALDLCYIS